MDVELKVGKYLKSNFAHTIPIEGSEILKAELVSLVLILSGVHNLWHKEGSTFGRLSDNTHKYSN
jgi:hypothetical protein